MKGVISIIAGGVVIFAIISMYLAYCKFLLRKAFDSFESGNLDKAKSLARLLHFTPFKACGYEILAEIAQQNGKYEDAVSLFAKALELDSSLENSWAGLFECQICMCKFDEASRVISEAADRVPSNELIKVYKILIAGSVGKSTLSQEELALLAKHNICLDRDACELKGVLLRICKP